VTAAAHGRSTPWTPAAVPRLASTSTNFQPSWSPDGRQIAFTHNDVPEPSPAEIYAVSPDCCCALTNLTNDPVDDDFFGDWGTLP